MASFSVRKHLVTLLHSFLHVLCLSSLTLGQIDTAFVDIAGEETNSTFVGKFARIGAIKQVEGELRELDGCEDDDNTAATDGSEANEESASWIGIIRIPNTFHSYRGYGSKCASHMEKVRHAIILGASALLILTVNQRVIKKLELAQAFSRPIVVFNGTNTARLLKALLRGDRAPRRARISYNVSPLSEVQMLSTLTLWATCGRPSGWEGVVCLGSPEKSCPVETTLHVLVYSVTSAAAVVLLIAVKECVYQWLESYWSNCRECLLRKHAADAISKMRVKKHKNGRGKLNRQMNKDSDVCAICLDGFFTNERVRILPCAHEFHCACVDSWLIDKRTCPLCKQNIMAELC